MVESKTVVHIIDSLGRGGAETLLVGLINSTPNFNHIIISLKPVNEFSQELERVKIYYLNFKWYHSIPFIIFQIKQILNSHRIDIIHAHLFWSVIVSRFACPSGIKLLNSYHSILYGKVKGKYPFYAQLLDKFTYYDNILTLCVSNEVRDNLRENIGIERNLYVLHNFIEDTFYSHYRQFKNLNLSKKVKMVAVGNLKKDKNYEVIIKAFAIMDAQKVHKVNLDIYGKGPLSHELQNTCQEQGLMNIRLKGSVNNISEVLPQYDVYIISSTSEGFGLAVVEAMAVGLPVLVSDIPALREVTGGNALFFNPLSPEDLTDKIKAIMSGVVDLQSLAIRGHEYSKKYRKKAYMEKLTGLYLS